MRIGVLGPLQVAGAEIGGARVRALLVRLALDPGRVVTADRLIDDLWPGEAPAHPTAALQSLVSRARREAPGLIASHPAGYLLEVPPGDVDARAFERLVRAGDARAALALWRGPALADAAGLPFAVAPAARLEELRLAALDAAISADLAEGGGPELVAELEELVAAHRLREPFHALLVRALAARGRRGEALEAYERIRKDLAEELGVDPGPELREAHLPELREAHLEALREPGGAPGSNLPARLTSFVGRSGDISRLRRVLTAPDTRLVTLVGPGGAGKTRLALETAAALDVPDGIWLVELAAAAGVRAAVESVLNVTDVVSALRGSSPLIVLDNCEHVIEEAATVARWLLSEIAGLRVLATSREPLDIPGETLHQVLPLPEAAELFRERAAAARPDLEVGEAEAARICRELDGIPLAIELAAARLRTMPVSVLVEQLGDRLAFRGGRTSEPRHRTLRDVIDWSWNLLSARERELLRGLTVFSGGATYEAIAQVCGGDPDDLSSLVNKSLISVSGDRYTMLETIRQYAAADLPALRQAHAHYYTVLAETAEPHLRTGGQVEWLAVLDAEQGNLDAALRHSDDPLRLILPRFWPWIMRGRRREMCEQAAAVLRRVNDVPPPGREAAHGLCRMLVGGPPTPAVLDSDHPAALNFWAMSGAQHPPGDVIELTERCVERLRDHHDPWTRSAALLVGGIVRFEYGAVAQAEDLLVPALDGFRGTGDRWGQWASLYWLSLVAENRGDFSAALALAEEPERLAAELAGVDAPLGPMTFLLRLGQLRARAGEHEQAAATLARAWQSALRADDALTKARVLHARAELARRTGDGTEGARLLERALALAGTEGPAQFRAYVNVELARVAEPGPPLRRALKLMETCGDRTARASVLEGAAEHLPPGVAAELLGAARALRGVDDSADPHLAALAARCRSALGADAFHDALTRGATLPGPERHALASLRTEPVRTRHATGAPMV